MRKIIAIIDTITEDITGPLFLFRHEAPAIRQFGDIAATPNTALHAHIEDYNLVQLGVLDDETLEITPMRYTIITGEQWKAATEAANNNKETE
jgi:hypothetical protein